MFFYINVLDLYEMLTKTMFFRIILLCFVVFCDSADEGDNCITSDSIAGTCISLEKCLTAREDIKRHKHPKLCGFGDDQKIPIVCCTDGVSGSRNVATTPKMSTVSSTTEYETVYTYYDEVERFGGCQAISPNLTAKKTGQKAFDKCIDYQHEYVYPCAKTVALTGDPGRANHCHHNADGLIIGGNSTDRNEFPHMAMLGYGDDEQTLTFQCGGSVISDRFVLTAGHCITNRERLPVSYVQVGAHTRTDANHLPNRYKLKRVIKHPDYQPPRKYNDIALLETEKTIVLSEFIVPACLHIGDPVNNEKVLATGWGLTHYRNPAEIKGLDAEVLQKVILNKFTTEECAAKYTVHRHTLRGFDPETQYCYGDKLQAKDTCYGDSGGPIQIQNTQLSCMYTIVGVTSFGRACGMPGEPGIYTRVAHYVPWIESIVWP